ncbi:hypothetical protein AB0I81_38660 [Nonomuraea sp. NPDC050404]|uniref:hypothetical protein n=1 Tax=Nonomuraea sp. NPDC050404 TaxID=3155783 RepID=UPI0033C726D0
METPAFTLTALIQEGNRCGVYLRPRGGQEPAYLAAGPPLQDEEGGSASVDPSVAFGIVAPDDRAGYSSMSLAGATMLEIGCGRSLLYCAVTPPGPTSPVEARGEVEGHPVRSEFRSRFVVIAGLPEDRKSVRYPHD